MANIEKQRATPSFTTGTSRFLSLLLASFKAQSVLFVIIAIYMLATYMRTSTVPGIQSYDLSLAFFVFTLPVLLLAMVVLRFINICVHVKPDRPLQALLSDLKDYLTDSRRMSQGLPVIIVLFFFIEAFTFTKVNIPALKPYEWDIYFMELDRWMHFGVHPWQILQPIFGYAPVTFIISVNYNTWFIVMWTVFVWQAFAEKPSILRLQFFISFLLVWAVGGSIFAVVFSSAGPAFYSGLNLSPNPYEGLMTYLYQVNETLPIWALSIQEMLWASYTSKQGLVAGISAMPSLHNASAVLMALLGWRVSRTHGIILTIFAVMIFLGSIHLGWHYAVDGYLGAAIAIIGWWIAGKIATWLENSSAAKAYQAQMDQFAK